jgi:hypothetical protein
VVPGQPNMMRSFAIYILIRFFITYESRKPLRSSIFTIVFFLCLNDFDSHKTKQFLVLLIKLLIVGCAFLLYLQSAANNDKLDWAQFLVLFKKNLRYRNRFILLVYYRYLEILKWQNLVSSFKPISVAEATKQVLAALTAGIFTPNGVGEYAGKAIFLTNQKLKK